MITTTPQPLEAAAASPMERSLRRFRANKIGLCALGMVGLLAVIAVAFFVLDVLDIPWPMDPDATNLERKLLSPNPVNWLGTDNLGRDVFSRLLNGAYISLTVGFVAVFVSLFILAEAGLSFLGFGVQPPQATWGNIIADGKSYILDAWWLILFPGLAILIAALSFYLTGDALRQAVETRSERQ